MPPGLTRTHCMAMPSVDLLGFREGRQDTEITSTSYLIFLTVSARVCIKWLRAGWNRLQLKARLGRAEVASLKGRVGKPWAPRNILKY